MRTAVVALLDDASLYASFHAEIDLPGGVQRVWTGSRVFTDTQGTVWQPIYNWGNISDITQESATISSGFTIELMKPFGEANENNASSFANALRSDFNSAIRGRECHLYIQAWNSSAQPVFEPQWIAGGRMSAPRVSTSHRVASISVDVSGFLADGSQPAHGFVTDEDQRSRSADDNFLQFVAQLHTRDIRWPR